MTRPARLETKTALGALPEPLERKSAFSLDNEPEGTAWAIVAVTGVLDDVGDIIEPGAFGRTLSVRQVKGVLGHDWNRPVARAKEIVELMPGDSRLPRTLADGTTPWPREAGALLVKAVYNLNTRDGRDAFEHAKFYGPDHGYSIGYKVVDEHTWIDKKGVRHIGDLDLYEFSPVLHGANRLATLQAVKAAPDELEFTDLNGAEVKARYVRDADYWGRPLGTLITPGMKPRGRVATALRRKGKTPDPALGAAPDPETAHREGSATGKASAAKVREYEREIDNAGLFPEPEPTGRLRADRTAKGDADTIEGAYGDLIESLREDDPNSADAGARRDAAMRVLLREGEQPDEVEERLSEDLADDLDGDDGDAIQTDVDDFVDSYRRAARQRATEQESGQAAPARPAKRGKPAPAEPVADGGNREDVGVTADRLEGLSGAELDTEIGKLDDDQLNAVEDELTTRARREGRSGNIGGRSDVHQAVYDAIVRRENPDATPAPDADVPAAGGAEAFDADAFAAEHGYTMTADRRAPGQRVMMKPGGENSASPSIPIAVVAADGTLWTGGRDSAQIHPSEMEEYARHREASGVGQTGATYGRHTLTSMRKRNGDPFASGDEGGAPADTDTPDAADGAAPDGAAPDAADEAEPESDPLDAASNRGYDAIQSDDEQGLADALADLGVDEPGAEAAAMLDMSRRAATERLGEHTTAAKTRRDSGDQTGDVSPDGDVAAGGQAPDSGADTGEADSDLPPGWRRGPTGKPVDPSPAGVYRRFRRGGGYPERDYTNDELEAGASEARRRGDNLTERDIVDAIRKNGGRQDPHAELRDGQGNWREPVLPNGKPAPKGNPNWTPEQRQQWIDAQEAEIEAERAGRDEQRRRDEEAAAKLPSPEAQRLGNALRARGVNAKPGALRDAAIAGGDLAMGKSVADLVAETPEENRETLAAALERAAPALRAGGNGPQGEEVADLMEAGARALRGEPGADGDQEVTGEPEAGGDQAPSAADTPADTAPDALPDTPDAADAPPEDGADTGAGPDVPVAGETRRTPAADLRPGMVVDVDGQQRIVRGVEPPDEAGRTYVTFDDGERVEMNADDSLEVVSDTPTPDGVPADGPALDPDEARLDRDDLDAAQDLEADAIGLHESEDGEFEVTEDVAQRQDRVETLLEDAAQGNLDVSGKTTEALGGERRDLVEELRLQEVIRRREAQRRRDGTTPPGDTGGGDTGEPGDGGEGDGGGGGDGTDTPPTPPKPKTRPGLGGAAEDLADAIESGDPEAVTRAATRARRSLNRSSNDTDAHRRFGELLDALAGGQQVDPAELRTLAEALREEARRRRNDKARARRLAKKLERERLRGLISQYDAELRRRNLDPAGFGGPVPERGEPDATDATPDGGASPPDNGPPSGDTTEPGGGTVAPPPDVTPDGGPDGGADTPPPAPTTGPAVQAMLDSVNASPHRMLINPDAMGEDPEADLKREAADAAFRPVVQRFGPSVAGRSDDSLELARRAMGNQDTSAIHPDGVLFATLIPAAQRRDYLTAMRAAVADYKTNLAALRAARENPPDDRGPAADVPDLSAAAPERVGMNGRLRALAPRPLAERPAGTRPFQSVEDVVARLRDMDHPRADLPDYQRLSEDNARKKLIENITTGKESYLSPGGGLLAYRDEDSSPKRWRVIHTGSGAEIDNAFGTEISLDLRLRWEPSGPGYDLDGPGMRGLLDALERVQDARGNQVDWTGSPEQVDASVRAWRDYNPNGSYTPPPDGRERNQSVLDAALLEAVRTEPGRYALTSTFGRASWPYERRSENVLSADKVGGTTRSRGIADRFHSVQTHLNNGRKRTGYAPDVRTNAERKADAETARVVNVASLNAMGGDPVAAVAALRAEAQRLRESGREQEGSRLTGPIPPSWLDALADEVAEGFSSEPGELERLVSAGSGDRILSTDTLYGEPDERGARFDAGVTPVQMTIVDAPTLSFTRQDGTAVYRFTATANGISPGLAVDDPRTPFEVEIDTASGIRILQSSGGARSHGYLGLQANGGWAVVPAGQQPPATPEEVARLSRRSIDGFNREHGLASEGDRGDADDEEAARDADPVVTPDPAPEPDTGQDIVLGGRTLRAEATPMRVADARVGDLVAVPGPNGTPIVGTLGAKTPMGDLSSDTPRALQLRILGSDGQFQLITLSGEGAISRLTVPEGKAVDLPEFDTAPRVDVDWGMLTNLPEGTPIRLMQRKGGERLPVVSGVTMNRSGYETQSWSSSLIRTPDGRVVDLQQMRESMANDGSAGYSDFVMETPGGDALDLNTPIELDEYGAPERVHTPYKSVKTGDRVAMIRDVAGLDTPEGEEYPPTWGWVTGTVTEMINGELVKIRTDNGVIISLSDYGDGLELRRIGRGSTSAAQIKADAQARREARQLAHSAITDLTVLNNMGIDNNVLAKATAEDPAGARLRRTAAALRADTSLEDDIVAGDIPGSIMRDYGTTPFFHNIGDLAHLLDGRDDAPSGERASEESQRAAAKISRELLADQLDRMADAAESVEALGPIYDDEGPAQVQERAQRAARDIKAADPRTAKMVETLAEQFLAARGIDAKAAAKAAKNAKSTFDAATADAAFRAEVGKALAPIRQRRLRDLYANWRLTRSVVTRSKLDEDETTEVYNLVRSALERNYGSAVLERSPDLVGETVRAVVLDVEYQTSHILDGDPTAIERELYGSRAKARSLPPGKLRAPQPHKFREAEDSMLNERLGDAAKARRSSDLAPATDDHAAGIAALREEIADGMGRRIARRTRLNVDSIAGVLSGNYEMTHTDVNVLDKDERDNGTGATARRHLEVTREAGRRMIERAQALYNEKTAAFAPHWVAETDAQKASEKARDAYLDARRALAGDVDKAVIAALREAGEDPDTGYTAMNKAIRTSPQRRGALKKIMNEARRKIVDDLAAEYKQRIAEVDRLEKEAEDTASEFLRLRAQSPNLRGVPGEMFREALSEIRPMGLPEGMTLDDVLKFESGSVDENVLRQTMAKALRWYPSDWIRAMAADAERTGQKLTIAYVTPRAHFDPSKKLINVGTYAEDESVMTHELGHWMEKIIPGLTNAEWMLQYDRTAHGAPGERKSEDLHDLGGSMKGELVRKDRWRNLYTGKVYRYDKSDQPFEAWEIFTTALQNVVEGDNLSNLNDSSYLDGDLREWLYGVMALLPGTPAGQGGQANRGAGQGEAA